VLDYHDGLPGAAQQDSDGSTVIAGSQGRVWFITNHGLAWMDPAHPVHNDLAPPVLILAALENGRRFDVTPGLKLPAGATHLEIDYTAPSLTMPERVRFRYRLEGVDENWIDPGLRRQAYYTNLKPGKYRFQVIAANNDGVWNNTGAAWTFEIPPTFVQSKWFIALCAVSVLGVMWFAYAVRLRYMAERIQGRLQERVTERERIARELHDTLLQGFQGVVLRFQSVADQLSDAQAKRRMEDVLERADEVLLEGRDRVMDLRSLDASSDLSETLIAAGQDVIINPAISFQVRTTGTTRAIHPVVFEETIKIGREAISNAAQHGHPSDIEASIDYRRRHLSLRVRDNGGGIEPAILRRGAREGHFGLPGMRERARKIRADFHLTSRTGLGTEVRVVVPAGVAYAAASPRKAPSPLRFAFLGRR
jgi:signal transduction histidine kinase